jgi:hypothetical protein
MTCSSHVNAKCKEKKKKYYRMLSKTMESLPKTMERLMDCLPPTNKKKSWCWWLVPAILAIQRAEIRRISV